MMRQLAAGLFSALVLRSRWMLGASMAFGGELDHLVYSLHLTAWLLIAGAVLWHLGAVLRRGGMALAGSMFQRRMRDNDRPRQWWPQVQGWFQRSI